MSGLEKIGSEMKLSGKLASALSPDVVFAGRVFGWKVPGESPILARGDQSHEDSHGPAWAALDACRVGTGDWRRGDRAGFGADAARLQRWMGGCESEWVFGSAKTNSSSHPKDFFDV